MPSAIPEPQAANWVPGASDPRVGRAPRRGVKTATSARGADAAGLLVAVLSNVFPGRRVLVGDLNDSLAMPIFEAIRDCGNGCHQRTIAEPHEMPAPKAQRSIVWPGSNSPFSSISDSAIGTVALDVLPYLLIVR